MEDLNDEKYLDKAGDKHDKDIILSKSIKAGKRIYYIDVKRDRRDDLYLSITESKKILGGADGTQVSFEKHKIFLYKEDLDKFRNGLNEAIDYINNNQSEAIQEENKDEKQENQGEIGEIRFDIEF